MKKLQVQRISFFEFIQQETLIYGNNLNQFFDQVTAIHRQTIINHPEENLSEKIVSGEVLKNQLQDFSVIEFGTDFEFEYNFTYKFANSKQPVFNKNFDLLGENLVEYRKNGYEIFILSHQEKQIERLQAIFKDIDANVKFMPLLFTLHEGFVDHDLKICVLHGSPDF